MNDHNDCEHCREKDAYIERLEETVQCLVDSKAIQQKILERLERLSDSVVEDPDIEAADWWKAL